MRKTYLQTTLTLVALIVSAPVLAQSSTVNLTLAGGRFHPAETTAPANREFTIVVSNADGAPAEFESNTLRVEKVMSPGATIRLQIRPLAPGKYRYFNDFDQKADGYIEIR